LNSFVIEQYSTQEQMYLYYAKAFLYEKLIDTDNAFSNYKKANDIKRKTYNFNINFVDKSFQNLAGLLIEKYKITQNIIKKDIEVDFVPVFVVGMPRSGSTLIEQILATRDDVQGMGEVNCLNQTIASLFKDENFDVDNNLNILVDLDLDQIKNLANVYKESILQKAKRQNIDIKNKKYFVDKMLSNFRFIPLIKLMFPQAIIIHAKRKPMDTCWSCYKHYLAGENPYVYNLSELAAYYNAYRKMIDLYHEQLPNIIFEFDYEQFIAEPEQSLNLFLQYCNFDWNENHMNFHRNQTSVKTASCMQVKEPLNSRSIDSWQKYAQYLDNLEKNIDSKYK
jgi:hypothetical protein